MRQPRYAETLARIGRHGADVLYRGELARLMAADFQAHGGFVTLEDVRSARTGTAPTYRGGYAGDSVVTDGPPGLGASYIQALHILEDIGLARVADRVAWSNLLARTFQVVYAFRAEYGGDPQSIAVPTERFLALDEAARLADDIRTHPDPVATAPPDPRVSPQTTTSVTAIDQWGNAAVVTHSNGSCSGVITPELGFLYNNHMHNFDPRAGMRNSVGPGKRPEHGTPPVIWFRDGRLVGLSGSLSRFAFTADLQVTLALLDQGTDLQTAIDTPRLHAEYSSTRLYVESGFPADVLAGLAELGWQPEQRPMTAPLCMIRRAGDGSLHGAIDPRGDGGHWPPA